MATKRPNDPSPTEIPGGSSAEEGAPPIEELLDRRARARAGVEATTEALTAPRDEAVQKALRFRDLEHCQQIGLLPPEDEAVGEALVEANESWLRLQGARQALEAARQGLAELEGQLADRRDEARLHLGGIWVRQHKPALCARIREAEHGLQKALRDFGPEPAREDHRRIVDQARAAVMMAWREFDRTAREAAEAYYQDL